MTPYTPSQPFLVAAVQISPAFLDRDATVDRACQAIAEAGTRGARLVVFPEAFVPGYPLWVWSIAAGRTQELRALYAELLDQAVTVPSAAVGRLCDAARAAGVYVAIGINERNTEASGTSLFNSLLFIDAEGSVVGVHRKLVPTAGERLVHAQGDGSTLTAYDTPLGRLAGLICWENYMPLPPTGAVRRRRTPLCGADVGPRRALALDVAAHREGGPRLRDRLLQRDARRGSP